jgi:hypothetical protein
VDKPKRVQIPPWMWAISPMGGIGVIVLATHGWRIAAYALYVACMFLAVVCGASMGAGSKEAAMGAAERAMLLFRVKVLSVVALFYLAAIACAVLVGIALTKHDFRLGAVGAVAEFFFASLGGTSIGWAVDMWKVKGGKW